MASRTMSSPTNEIDFLKKTLHAQQELLQKLYTELDEERESSNIATSEALSMILRLQGEKSATKMEANQYKRIAEEKMCHAQQTLEIFQEIIYQKEMQIASLEFQVQAYKFKLISMGCDDLGISETQYPNNILSRKHLESSRSSFRRGSSLPPPPVNGTLSRRVSTEGPNSHLEEIRNFEDRIRESDNLKGSNGNINSNNLSIIVDTNRVLQSSVSPIQIPSSENSPTKSGFFGSHENGMSIQDIFEVPICSNDNQGDDAIEKQTLTLPMENEKNNDKNIFESNDAKEKNDCENKLCFDGIDKELFYKHATNRVSDFDLEEINTRLKQLEDERFMPRKNERNGEIIKEELRLLEEIREEIDSLKGEITSWTTKKPLLQGADSPGCLKEVLLCFWP